jgi:hypothetical protein
MPETDSARMANCGLNPDVDFSNREPLQELKAGDVFKASDFPVRVTQITNADGNGRFSGEGLVPIGWILHVQFQVEFTDILLNTDKQMIDGKVKFKYDETWGNILDLGSNNNQGGSSIKIDITVDFVIPPNPEFEYNDSTGMLVIYDLNGEPHNVDLPKNSDGKVVFPVTIKDADGNVYEVDEETYIDENGDEQKRIVIEKYDDSVKDIDEVIVQGLSDNYEIVIDDDIIKCTTKKEKEFILVYEQQTLDMRLQKNNKETIDNTNIEWQVTVDKKTEIFDSILTKEIKITDKDVDVVIYEKFKDKKEKIKKALIAKLKFVLRASPYVKFSVSNYNGEFGFDDGEDFDPKSNYESKTTTIKSIPKVDYNMQYDTIHIKDSKGKTKILYVPWITLLQGQTETLNVDIAKDIEDDNIYIETTNEIIATYNKTTKTLTVTNNSLNNNFDNPAHVTFYRDDKYGLQKKMVIGKCAVVGRPTFNPINVQIVYFAKNTNQVKNTIDANKLQNILTSHSLNQAFARFTVLPNIIRIKDDLDKKTREIVGEAYDSIQKRCKKNGMLITDDRHPTTIYIVLTELTYKISEDNDGKGRYRAGGVKGKNNFAVMWLVENSKDEMEKVVAHEIGHTLGLEDVFNDGALGRPKTKFSRNNYMDYDIIRKMFFKTQIQTIINNLNKGEN